MPNSANCRLKCGQRRRRCARERGSPAGSCTPDRLRTSFRDDMGNHPITVNAWSPYEIQAPIAPDARDIEFGMQLIGQGAAWIDNISMTFVDMAK
jgi:hypothetical protein